MKTLMIYALSVLILIIVIMIATLVRNQAHFFKPPGLGERLSVYLTRHTAETSDNHSFLELRTPVFNVDTESLFNTVLTVCEELGWEVVNQDVDNQSINIVITTPLLGFQDDMKVQVILVNSRPDGGTSALFLRSTSRVGKADFAANAGHIQTLVAAVEYRLRSDALRLFEK